MLLFNQLIESKNKGFLNKIFGSNVPVLAVIAVLGK